MTLERDNYSVILRRATDQAAIFEGIENRLKMKRYAATVLCNGFQIKVSKDIGLSRWIKTSAAVGLLKYRE